MTVRNTASLGDAVGNLLNPSSHQRMDQGDDYVSVQIDAPCTCDDLRESLEEAMGGDVSQCAAPLDYLYVARGMPILFVKIDDQVEIRRYRSGLTLAQFIMARAKEEKMN